MVVRALRPCLATFVLVVTAMTGTALADYGPLLTIEQLTDSTSIVVKGRVYSVDSVWDTAAATIYTYVVLEVDEVLRGDVPHQRIVVKQLGGVVGDVGLSIGGQPGFVPGERVLVFLHVRPRDNTLQTANFWQGKWSIEPRQPGDSAVRHAGRDGDGNEVAYRELDLATLERRIRARQSTARRFASETIVFHPGEAPEPVNAIDAVGRLYKIPFLGFSWHEAFSAGTIPVNFHKTKHATAGSGKRQLNKAYKAWNGLSKIIKWMSKGKKIKTAAPGGGQRPGDASMMMQNGDPLQEISNASSTLAVGGAWFFSGPTIRNLGPAFSGYLLNNDSASAEQFMANKTCYETVEKHELGHVAGLGHSDKSPNLMEPSVDQASCDAGKALGKDDAKFFKKMYHKKYARGGS